MIPLDRRIYVTQQGGRGLKNRLGSDLKKHLKSKIIEFGLYFIGTSWYCTSRIFLGC